MVVAGVLFVSLLNVASKKDLLQSERPGLLLALVHLFDSRNDDFFDSTR
jgi:hypothetical protein